MSTILLKRGSSADVNTYTGLAGELVVDTTNWNVRICDGSTAGGKYPVASSLAAGRTIALSGDATGSVTFDGTADKNITVALASSGVTAGTYNNVTVDAKGRVTSGSNTTFATVATSGSYNDLSNKPTIPSAYTHPTSGVSAGTYNNVTVNAQGHVTSGSNASYAAANHTHSGYASSSHSHSYLPLSGGTCTGTVKAPSFQISSDIRLKSDLQKIDNALDKVSQLTAYTYNKQEIKTRQAGLIAQDVEKILPEAVGINDDGYKTIDYQAVTALLINAINELRQKYESKE